MRTVEAIPTSKAHVPSPRTVDALLPLALSRPIDALNEARAVLDGAPDPASASVAHQAAGIVLRDRGELGAALGELRAAQRNARVAGLPAREADVAATLGAALVMAGRTAAGLAALERAAAAADGQLLATVQLRLAHVLHVLGRHDEALPHVRTAVAAFRSSGDVLWEARSLNNRCIIYLALGSTRRAEADAVRAGRLFALAGQELESAQALHNRGLAAHQRGDLPLALRLLDAAVARYEAIGVAAPDTALDQAAVRLAAGLATDAVAGLTDALAAMDVAPVKRAELLLATATAALATGDDEQAHRARALAKSAADEFRRQRRHWWAARAELVGVQARYAAGDRGRRLLLRASTLAVSLESEHREDAPLAHLLAGRLATHWNENGLADTHFAAAARCRRSGSALVRATGWLAEALRRDTEGDSAAVLAACRRGLDVLDEHRLTLGATELRAVGTAHGREITALALHHALRRGPRALLRSSERSRATVLALPPARQPDEAELVTELAALRDVVRRLDVGRREGGATQTLERELHHREDAVRRRRLHVSGAGGTSPRLDLGRLVEALDTVTLVELVDVDGILHAVVVRDGRVRRVEVGPAAAADREVQFARFALRRAAYGRPRSLDEVGHKLQAALLGPATRWLADRDVVVVPPARLLAVPWALLPALRDRPVAVAPSAALWLRARTTRPPVDRQVVLVAGPDLGTGGAEVLPLAERNTGARVLRDGSATAANVVAALDGAWLAHVAAHGVFRADSPLFSSLLLDDGPLTVHDLELVHRAPYRLVLAACDSGVGAAVGADELLGMVTALLSLGTAGVVASVCPVNDEATVPLMLALHAALAAGSGLASALATARRAVAADPVGVATGASFVAVGV